MDIGIGWPGGDIASTLPPRGFHRRRLRRPDLGRLRDLGLPRHPLAHTGCHLSSHGARDRAGVPDSGAPALLRAQAPPDARGSLQPTARARGDALGAPTPPRRVRGAAARWRTTSWSARTAGRSCGVPCDAAADSSRTSGATAPIARHPDRGPAAPEREAPPAGDGDVDGPPLPSRRGAERAEAAAPGTGPRGATGRARPGGHSRRPAPGRTRRRRAPVRLGGEATPGGPPPPHVVPAGRRARPAGGRPGEGRPGRGRPDLAPHPREWHRPHGLAPNASGARLRRAPHDPRIGGESRGA